MTGIGTGLAAISIGARLTGVSEAIKRVPRWVWIVAAIALAIAAGSIWHGRRVAAHDRALTVQVIARRDGQWMKRLTDEHRAALAWKTQADRQLQTITNLQRKLADDENRRIAADAAAVRMRGPGAAAAPAGCRPGDHAGLPGSTDRRTLQPGAAAHAGTEVPAGDGADRWAVVPWDWLVDAVGERDAFRNEAIAWRGWHASIAGTWQRWQAAAAAVQGKQRKIADGR